MAGLVSLIALPVLAETCGTVDDRWNSETTVPPPHADLVWEWPNHRAWFTRFWSGDCAAQLEGCREWVPFAGAPHWQAITARTLDRAAPADRPRLRCRLFDLGRRIGHEWSRESQVRTVDTARLGIWSKELNAADGSAQIDQAIDRLEGALARARGGD